MLRLVEILRYSRNRFRYELKRHAGRVRVINGTLSILSFILSIAVIVTLLVWIGFDHAEHETKTMWLILKCSQWVFTVTILFGLLFSFRTTVKSNRLIKWIVDLGILLLLIPTIYPQPLHPWINWLSALLYSPKFQFGLLTAYAVVDISYNITHLLSRRTNPSVLLGASFIILIFAGALILMMPRCTTHGISFPDSLFVSASAVCITGLTPVDIASTFTPLGHAVIAILFQLGALGIITFTSFFAIFFSGNQSIYSQLMMKDLVYSKTINALVPTLLYILGFTLFIELIGAVAIWFTIPDSLGLGTEDKITFAVFQSMSSFCNVGFTNIEDGLSNSSFMHGNQGIYIVVSILVIAGGIGFPLLVNLKDSLFQKIRFVWCRIFNVPAPVRRVHTIDLNTKVVLWTTGVIFVLGGVAFFFLESGNTMRGMSLYERIVQSLFNATTPRSSGFSSVNPAGFLNVTLILVMFQMWIGGASQSMAGGIKVNTFGTIILNLKSVILGRTGVTAFKRNIAIPSVRRANSIVTLSILSVLTFSTVILMLEPELSVKSAVFEVVSAVFTVGTSLGATEHLCTASKYVLIAAMFLGRVGLLSLLSGFFSTRRDLSTHYPSDNIIIN